jgi:hypothetical protein
MLTLNARTPGTLFNVEEYQASPPMMIADKKSGIT